MERRLDLVLEDLGREGPGSLLVTLRLLSRVRRGEMDLGLPKCGVVGGRGNKWIERGVSGSRYRS